MTTVLIRKGNFGHRHRHTGKMAVWRCRGCWYCSCLVFLEHSEPLKWQPPRLWIYSCSLVFSRLLPDLSDTGSAYSLSSLGLRTLDNLSGKTPEHSLVQTHCQPLPLFFGLNLYTLAFSNILLGWINKDLTNSWHDLQGTLSDSLCLSSIVL